MAEDAPHVLDSANFPRFQEAALGRAEAFHIHKILPQYEALYRRALSSQRQESPHRRTHCGQPLRRPLDGHHFRRYPGLAATEPRALAGRMWCLGRHVGLRGGAFGGERQFYLICMGFWALLRRADGRRCGGAGRAMKWSIEPGRVVHPTGPREGRQSTEAPLEELNGSLPPPTPNRSSNRWTSSFGWSWDRIHVERRPRPCVWQAIGSQDASQLVTLFNKQLRKG